MQWGSGCNQRTVSEPLRENKSDIDSEGGLEVMEKSQYTLKHRVSPDWLDCDIQYEKVFLWSQQRKQEWTAFDEFLQMSTEKAEILCCSLMWDIRSSDSDWLNNRNTLFS